MAGGSFFDERIPEIRRFFRVSFADATHFGEAKPEMEPETRPEVKPETKFKKDKKSKGDPKVIVGKLDDLLTTTISQAVNAVSEMFLKPVNLYKVMQRKKFERLTEVCYESFNI